MAKKAKVYKLGEKLGDLVATSAGLPNTCSATGRPITEDYWFAKHEDAARAGSGVCQAVAEALVEPEAPPKPPKSPDGSEDGSGDKTDEPAA
jgi:hypothetical protein